MLLVEFRGSPAEFFTVIPSTGGDVQVIPAAADKVQARDPTLLSLYFVSVRTTTRCSLTNILAAEQKGPPATVDVWSGIPPRRVRLLSG